MPTLRRERWVAGRHANVDGIPFRMPVGTKGSPALIAAYGIDPDGARTILPGQELHPLRVANRGVLIVTVVNYLDTTIGRYIELCAGILCTRGPRPSLPLLPLVLGRAFGLGVYIYDLPVSTEISVKGGLGIWGMPKRQANLDFVIGEETVSSQYDLDGQLVMRVDVPRPARASLPLRVSGVGYGAFRGLLTKSYIRLHGRMGVSIRGGPGAALLMGEHERATPLKHIGIDPQPLFTAFVPALAGVLDDHIETWFLTADAPPGPPAVGVESIVGLGLDQQWLAPPDREGSDRLLKELSPWERVGSR
jgi:Acetoacetate decarboxylase (ADC)